jgi:UDP-N-acetylglucosamine--N-acetylmuramyl-(pentapeptide) pyrophosphoryl-undecaprenol N-acetylglucosamine transferase
LTVILSGGGSGGHITPILAVAASIKKLDPGTRVIYIGQKGDSFMDIPKADPNIDKVFAVRAGKYRRYYGEGLRQVLDLKTFLLNARDFFYVLIGVVQSKKIIGKLKPNIIFTRGGFVSVPVAIGARLNKVPYITHDSDAVPSLANRLIAGKAIKHFVSMDERLYPYPLSKTINTGIPINSKFKHIDSQQEQALKKEIGLPIKARMILVIGGGLGAQNINDAFINVAGSLLNKHKDLHIIHIAGKANEEEVNKDYSGLVGESDRVKVFGYINDVYKYSGAADLIIARAGATNIAEFAAQAKPCIIIPSNVLVGGHQLKNALVLQEDGAAVVVNETILQQDKFYLEQVVNDLLADHKKRKSLSDNISKFAKLNASEDIAKLILSLGNQSEV